MAGREDEEGLKLEGADGKCPQPAPILPPQGDEAMADEDDEQGLEVDRGAAEGSQHANTPRGMTTSLEETPVGELHLELKARSQRNRRIRFLKSR
jgi:hypothetical protein